MRDGSSHLPVRTWWDADCESSLGDFIIEWMVEGNEHNEWEVLGLE